MTTKLKYCPICRSTTRVNIDDLDPVCNTCIKRNALESIDKTIFNNFIGLDLSQTEKEKIKARWHNY